MSRKFVPKGVLPALVTPFTKDGDIIEDGFKQIIDYTINKGATGVVPAGTTGEFVYMRTEERKKLLRLTVELVDGRVPVIAGTGQNSTKATLALTKYAADIGCTAALVVSPYFLRPADKGYYEHYATVARKADFPVILYNIPQCTLGVLQSNVVEDLAELDNIVAIKDSSGSIPHVLELIEKLKGKMPVLIGHDECFLSAITNSIPDYNETWRSAASKSCAENDGDQCWKIENASKLRRYPYMGAARRSPSGA
ncbi:MAG: dihydrodipicolinate synthase family protein [Candidatus Thorarchaeota archaeon]|jgi:4-hydroxy-tetrahydrodipicolinate synthase